MIIKELCFHFTSELSQLWWKDSTDSRGNIHPGCRDIQDVANPRWRKRNRALAFSTTWWWSEQGENLLTLRSKRNVSVNMVVISKQILLWKTNCIDATWGRQSSICRTCWKKSYPWGITINRTWLWPNKAWTQDLWGCSPGFDTRFFESCGSWDVFTSLPTWCSIHNEA